MKKKLIPILPVFCYILFIFFYLIWTYCLTDPNLVLTSWAPYWNMQKELWLLDDGLVAGGYVLLMSGLFASYRWLLYSFFQDRRGKAQKSSGRQIYGWMFFWLMICGLLLFSYNALSHDVFNYAFNARMVVKYGADPHVRTALEFASRDDWVRFMHNVHTPAPYWYGWTGLSLLPYLAGVGKFLTTWLSFKAFSALGLAVLVAVQIWLVRSLRLGKNAWWGVLAFAFHPLVLVELVSNAHNDAWMMAMAVGSLALIWQIARVKTRTAKWMVVAGSATLLLGSISQKYVTVLLLPVWLWLIWQQWQVRHGGLERVNTVKQHLLKKHTVLQSLQQCLLLARGILGKYMWEIASWLLFLPLLTARSQQFHPWYLVWSLSFLPFITLKWWRNALLILSVSSMFRYLPWIVNGAFEFTPEIQLQQRMITWMPVGAYLLFCITKHKWGSRKGYV